MKKRLLRNKDTNNKVSLQAKRRRRRSGRAGGRRLTPAPSLQRPTSGPTGRIGPAAGRIGPAADRSLGRLMSSQRNVTNLM
eukprot:scaffold79386_cov52-Phaeocystis_antarctica.AAC.1